MNEQTPTIGDNSSRFDFTTDEKGPVFDINVIDVETFFTEDGPVQALIDALTKAASGAAPDITTKEGRVETAARAARIANIRASIERAGKSRAAALKLLPKQVDAVRRKVADDLAELRDSIRRPLSEYEEAEQKRQDEIDQRLKDIAALGIVTDDLDEVLEAQKTLADTNQNISEALYGDKVDAARQDVEAITIHLSRLQSQILKNREREKEEAIEKERIAAEHREAVKAREEAEAATRALQAQAEDSRKEAEAKQREADDKIRAAREEADAAKIEAERKVREAQQEAEAQRKEREEMAEHQRRKEAEAAAEAERKSQDIEHRRQINTAAADALVSEAKLTPAAAKKVVTAIALGTIDHIRIDYSV